MILIGRGTHMKMKEEHFKYLRKEISKVFETYDLHKLAQEYEQGQFARSEKTKDLQQRFCFDVLFGAGLNKFVCDNLYSYLDDSHIFTALKAICPTVVKKY